MFVVLHGLLHWCCKCANWPKNGPEMRKYIQDRTPHFSTPHTHLSQDTSFLSRDPSLYLRTHPCMSGPVLKVLE